MKNTVAISGDIFFCSFFRGGGVISLDEGGGIFCIADNSHEKLTNDGETSFLRGEEETGRRINKICFEKEDRFLGSRVEFFPV